MYWSLFLLLAIPHANGYAAIGTSCQEFITTLGTTTDSTETICAVHELYGPSPAVIEDEVFYVGDYTDIFSIVETVDGMTPEQMESMDPSVLIATGVVIEVTRFTETEGCQVSIGGTQCANCQECNTDDTSPAVISVDCSAIPGGRSVTCEPLEKIFYPLLGFSRAASPSQSPVTTEEDGSGCLARGSECSTSLDCCSGRCMMNECRTSNILSRWQRSSLRGPGRGGAAGAAIDVQQGGSGIPLN